MTEDAASRARDLERRVYGPHPDPDAVARLTAELAHVAPVAVAEAPEPAADVAAARPLLRRLLPPIAGFLVLCAIAAVLAPHDEAVPKPVPTPSSPVTDQLDADTLVAFSRPEQPGTLPTTVTYQPNGYALVDPRGAALQAEMTCAGSGTVRVNLTDGTRFVFTCTARQQDLVQLDGHRHTVPFLVVAATTGDVVWDLKITAQHSIWRADLD